MSTVYVEQILGGQLLVGLGVLVHSLKLIYSLTLTVIVLPLGSSKRSMVVMLAIIETPKNRIAIKMNPGKITYM